MASSSQNFPVINYPVIGIDELTGLNISNNLTTPNTAIDIAPGQCADRNNVIGLINNSILVVDFSVNGANGLDTGSLGINNSYSIYLIGDSNGYNPVAGIATNESNLIPLMPLGYDSYRYIGFVRTDGGGSILRFLSTGKGRVKTYQWDIQRNVLSGGNQTVFTGVTLSSAMPSSINRPTSVAYIGPAFTATAGGNIFSIRATGSSSVIGSAPIECGTGVAGLQVDMIPFKIIPGFDVGGFLSIDYAVTVNTNSLSLDVVGFEESL